VYLLLGNLLQRSRKRSLVVLPNGNVLLVESSSSDKGQVALFLALAAVLAVRLLSIGLALRIFVIEHARSTLRCFALIVILAAHVDHGQECFTIFAWTKSSLSVAAVVASVANVNVTFHDALVLRLSKTSFSQRVVSSNSASPAVSAEVRLGRFSGEFGSFLIALGAERSVGNDVVENSSDDGIAVVWLVISVLLLGLSRLVGLSWLIGRRRSVRSCRNIGSFSCRSYGLSSSSC